MKTHTGRGAAAWLIATALALGGCEGRGNAGPASTGHGGNGATASGTAGGNTTGSPPATTTAGTTPPPTGQTAGTGTTTGAADPALNVLPPAGTGADPASILPKTTSATLASTPANYRIIGRADDSNQALGPLFGWPASGVTMAFRGTALAVQLTVAATGSVGGVTTTSYWDLVLDGAPPVVIGMKVGVTLYPISDRLGPGNHVVTLTRRTEAQFGAERFGGFLIDAAGAYLPPPAAPARRMEFIGDSITAGLGDLGTDATDPACVANATTENASIAYPALTAAALGAEYASLSFSGKGVLRNRDPVGDPVRTMPFLYASAVPLTSSHAMWDFTRFVPQVVVVNLGTNDLKADGALDTMQLTGAYVAFLAQIRAKYPDVFIFCLVGPELHGALLAQAQAAIHGPSVQSDARIAYLEFPEDTGVDAGGAVDQGCAWHPSRNLQAKMAAQLTTAVRGAMAW